MIRLAIDAMGGDNAPIEMIQGVNLAIKKYDDIEIHLFGDENIIREYLVETPRVKVYHAPEYLDMGVEDPIKALRQNPNYSMFQAIKHVKEGNADAVVTAGPTQGAVVGGTLILRRLKGMKRVAIAPFIPDFEGRTRILLDSGANVEFRAEHLLDFAVVASIISKSYFKVDNPVVGLVNIGAEPGKGRVEDIEAYELLNNNPSINFYGNVEPKELLSTDVDVIVTDGFTGNILMKSYEGAVKAFSNALKKEIYSSTRAKLGGLLLKKAFKNIKSNANPDVVGGAIIIGVDGILVKAHGSSNAFAFSNGIRLGRELAKEDIMSKIRIAVEELHNE
ncbi:MAG: phosphate acyltransferase PlsX [Acholeplasmataceae bacterium]|jgi:glycerol-3-phosphate acyltransferase PlsX